MASYLLPLERIRKIELHTMSPTRITTQSQPRLCSRNGCNGGQGFDIRDVLFCSPACGNHYWHLSPGDEDYWPHDDESVSDYSELSDNSEGESD